MKVAMIQTKQNVLYNFINPNRKFSKVETIQLQTQMVGQTLELIQQIEKNTVDLICTTEAINFCGDPDTISGPIERYISEYPTDSIFQQISEIAKEKNSWIVVGIYNKRKQQDGTYHCYNSTICYDRTGKEVAIYDKIHLIGSEKQGLLPGKDYVVAETEFGKMGLAICYDMQFKETCSNLKQLGAEFIVVPTWGWEQGYGYERSRECKLPIIATMAVPYWMPIEGLRNPSEIITKGQRVLARGSYTEAQVVVGEL